MTQAQVSTLDVVKKWGFELEMDVAGSFMSISLLFFGS
jgi:hypothetical protein